MVERDSFVEDFRNISSGAIVNGGVIRQVCVEGSGASTDQGVEIMKYSFFNDGSVVVK